MPLTIGEKLKKKRNELNLTLKELSDKSGILPQLISDYENGRKDPGIKNIKILARVLKLSYNYLLDESGFVIDNENTYGNVLHHYFEALKYSKKDKLVIDREKRKVSIEINDDILINVFSQMKDFIELNDELKKTMINFNVNILSNVIIEDK